MPAIGLVPGICLATVLTVGLCGCNGAIELGRSLSGMDKNDPDPATAPFTGNVDKAEAAGYGNLASVPPPPTLATTFADRQKLAANLTSERTSAQAKDKRGQPGSPTGGPVPPPPPVPPEIAAPEIAAAPPAAKPETPVPTRKMDEPPPPQPQDTTMQSPQIANEPGVGTPRPAPSRGHLAPAPAATWSSLPAAAVESGNPIPAPAQARLPEPKPSPQAAALPPPKLPPAAVTVAALDVPPNVGPLAAADQTRLAQAVARYQAKPSTVRVIAYAAPGAGSAEQLNAFRLALDRAQEIAKQLTASGIPAKQIQTEAAPSGPSTPPGRVEVQLLEAPGG